MTTESRSTVDGALPEWVRTVCDDLDLDALREVVVARDIDVAFPEHAGDEEFTRQLRASVAENLDALRDVLCGRRVLADLRLAEPLAFGEMQARLGIPQTALQRSYRVGFVAMWDEWVSRLSEHVLAHQVPVDEAIGAAAALARGIFGYQDHVASLVADTFARTDEALNRSRAHVRRQLVREVLRGGEELTPSDIVTVGYDFDAVHVAVVLPELAEGAAARLTSGLQEATGVRRSLTHPLSLASSVVWLGHTADWSRPMRAELLAVLGAAGVLASVSEPHRGPVGFRRCLAQAQEVEQVRAASAGAQPRVLDHDVVALEILLLQDPGLARRFVQAELGPLAEADLEAARLRETLEASFRCGSHVATAELLALHEHTVRNRLHRAEERLGHAVAERVTEIQVALRLYRLLRWDETTAAGPG